MNSYKAILTAAGFALLLIFGIGSFNYAIDPMCYYHCPEIQLTRATSNSYYQAAQKVLAHPDTQQILLGSSRAGTTSPHYLEKVTGLKSLGLDVAGADVMVKLALMNFAIEKSKIKRIIWYADYFEIIPANTDEKFKSSPALRNLLPAELASAAFEKASNPFLTLIDQNTIAASVNALKVNPLELAQQLSGNAAEYASCDQGEYKTKETEFTLQKKIELLFENYTQKVMKPEPSQDYFGAFASSIKALESRGIDVVIVIAPYHPTFMSRLEKEFPEIYLRHKAWVEKVASMATPHIRVLDYSSGIPGGDGSTKYWSDGVHFSCVGAEAMMGALK